MSFMVCLLDVGPASDVRSDIRYARGSSVQRTRRLATGERRTVEKRRTPGSVENRALPWEMKLRR
jgi:hypothetical protein